MNKTKIFFIGSLIMITMILVALGTSAAWFIFEAHYFTPRFETSVIKTDVDAESGDGKTDSTPFLITKPVHLYNLAYLQDKGIFNGDTLLLFLFELLILFLYYIR